MKIYKTYFLPEFFKQAKKHRHLKKILANKIKLLLKNPYENCKSEKLVGELKGLRSARITKSFRIIFSICKECRAGNNQEFVGCRNSVCEKMDLKTIVFLTFGPHDDSYSIK